ncbi:7-cyano-7-deazaguanine reductase, partial [mine drainage metagenome]
MNPYEHTALGKPAVYPRHIDASVLAPIPRAAARADLGLAPHAPLPFHGEDLWGCYELSWLDDRGKPVRALAELRVPADSPQLIESKSLKLYLNGYAGARMADADAARARIAQDLSAAAGSAVRVALLDSAVWARLRLHAPP